MRKSTELENPYPSAPSHPGRYVVYARQQRDDGKHVFVTVWRARYAARHAVELIIDGRDYELDGDEIAVGDIVLQADTMDEIMSKDLNDLERAWVMPEPDRSMMLRLSGKRIVRDEEKVALETASAVRKVVKPERAHRAPRDGLVSVQDMAKQLGVDARDCRVVLRKLKVEKPAAGWAWPDAEAAAMFKTIKKSLGK